MKQSKLGDHGVIFWIPWNQTEEYKKLQEAKNAGC